MKKSNLIKSCILGMLTFALLFCQQPSETEPYEAGITLELARERAGRLSDVQYNLHFDLPANKADSIPAELELRFTLQDAHRPLVLDFKADSVQAISVLKDAQPVTFSFGNEHLIIPAAALREGANTFTIRFLAGDQSLNRSDDYLYTLLVPDRARTLFPCFDQPDLKARYRLSLSMPAGWTAVANGALAEEREEGDRRRLSFADTRPLSTYLFAFAAGRFRTLSREVDGRPMTMYFRETDDQKVQANADTIFGLHGAALRWLEDYTGIPYPFEKFDFALLPGFQYGGMEHPGAIFYREPSLMLDPAATENQQLRRASLIAHETAHMWFGDLVTMRWFNDVWLKEVFANFMAAKIVNPSFPDINHRLNFLLSHQPAAYGEDRSRGAHPIQQPLENLKDAGTLYGRIVYQKAPVVMQQLEKRMGEAPFQDGLREYLNTYPFANATWDDLTGILQKHTAEELQDWSQAWVKETGMPEISYALETAAGEINAIRLQQETRSSGGKYWPQYTEAALIYPDSVVLLPVQIDGAGQTVAVNTLPVPAALLPNASEMSYGYFRLDSLSRAFLLDHLSELEDPLLRGAGWMALYEACLRDALAPETLMEAILNQLPAEQEPLNRQALMGYLETLYWRFYRPEQREAVAPRIESMLWDLLNRARETSARAAYFRTFRSLALSPGAKDRLYRIWYGELAVPDLLLSETDYIDLACELALRYPVQAQTILEEQLSQTRNPDRNQRLAFIRPALAAEQAVRDSFFYSLREAENRHYEPWVVDALGYLHHPLRAKDSEKYIRPSLELLEEIQATGDIFFPRQWVTATLSGHQSAAAAVTVRQFLEEKPDYPYRLRNKILMAADMLFRVEGD